MRYAIYALGLGLGLATGALTGCDQAYDPDAPAIDPNAPRVHITSPARGTFAGDVERVTVTGTAFDDEGVTAVFVNGVSAALAADGTFSVNVPVIAGTNLLHAIARDAHDNLGKETRAVVAGPVEPLASFVPQSITASVTAQTFEAIGRGLTGLMTGPNLRSSIAPFNPVLDLGSPSGPDCLYAQADITGVSLDPTSKITLATQLGGIYLEADLVRPNVNLGLRWSVSCVDGAATVAVGATRIHVSGVLKLGVNGGKFEVYLDQENVQITGLQVDLGGIPGEIVDLLNLDTAMGPVLAWTVEQFAVPYVNGALAGLNETRTIDVLGTPVDIKVRPARIEVDVPGAIVELDTELRARNDGGSPGFVYVPNQVPDLDLTRGFELSIADDGANQLLASYWAAKGLTTSLDLKTGSYGEVGRLYDRVELSAAVPPFIDASGDKLRLTVGDLLATFKNGPAIATMVAINAELELAIVADPSGALRLDVGKPIVYVDVLDENVDGANQLSNAQFEAVSSFALSRVVAFGSGAVGAIPLPAFGGVSFQNVDITDHHGYVVIGGDLR